ncbi:hypothetical protein IQ265_10260 [Nodosilinea sp. LEGE 06152]|uniref:hypothetical protein n=1 Tax=Nodosilinea sp. LEGE 06152 TaxID=2777966 RepID=UPI001881E5F4|nr:hypothetical protein [Nodosilinea sp. LEGE 06152]MBE9157205.1 hypothetical protein [Nodosilinea sp. LEGE 06152]
MATVRLIVVVLVLGLVVLLGVQNLAPALPLVFFGGSTQALPLGIWLTGAVLLGALTTLALTAVLGSVGASNRSRSAAYKYRPQSFYEPTGSAPGSGAASASRAASDRRSPPPYTNPASRAAGSGRASSSPGDRPPGDSADDDPSWRAWTNLQSPARWNDWESLSRASTPSTSPPASGTPLDAASGIIDGVTTWFSSSKQQAKQQQRVNESLRELDDDWGGLENQPYTTPGVSPVQDSLDDISQGWEQGYTRPSSQDINRSPDRNFEAPQAPRRVYQDGSLYSYSYRDDDDSPAPSGQVDNIYAPPDDVSYGSGSTPRYADSGSEYASETVYSFSSDAGYDETYSAAPNDDDTPLSDPEMAEDGVVDADYRVIVPPYSAAAEAAATSDWANNRDDSTAIQNGDDEWDAADDALTP